MLLDIPVLYIISDGATIEDTILMNNNQKSWKNRDYLKCFSHKNHKNHQEYRKVKKFFDDYNLNFSVSINLLSGNFVYHGGGNSNKAFKEGKFKIKNLEQGKLIAKRINKIGEYFEHYKKRTFVTAMIFAIREKDFAWTRFEQKLENFSSILKNQGSRHDFLVNIEKLYNHKTSIDKRIRFNLNLKA